MNESANKAIHAVWTFPGIVFSAFILAWAAESAQFLVSQALSLAILAWLQTLPEFAVEAVIAWERNVHLITANFTGSLRLLVGIGWPLVYFTAAVCRRRRCRRSARTAGGDSRSPGRKAWLRSLFSDGSLAPIGFDREHAVEVMGLLPPLGYFWIIYFKGTLNLIDSVFLVLMYVLYLMVVRQVPPQDQTRMEELERIPKKILSLSPLRRNIVIAGLFLVGGTALLLIARPFLHSMLGLAATIGISDFVFVQWVAPFLSEFPEKVSAFYWARTKRGAPMGFMNMVSSNINQWTLLVGMIPIVFSISAGGYSTIVFDEHQKMEILLTMAQSILGFMLLANMEFRAYEGIGLFGLWLVQFVMPDIREEITIVYFGWAILEILLAAAGKKKLVAFRAFGELWKEHDMGSGFFRPTAKRR
ncbi:MAG: hypothetical protein V2A71_08760 [Candidatus Eisenbacteria bacterium]